MTWPTFWKTHIWQTQLLKPLSAITCWIARRRFQQFQQHPSDFSPRPKVIVVGNIVVGGSGKTPFIQWLGKQLDNANISFGIISRGYGGKAEHYPLEVQKETPASQSGDEPLMLKKHFDCPVVVAPERREALKFIMQRYPELDVVIADDGLQHFALPRDFEVVLMDGERGIGNGLCLPAGPLREPIQRLDFVDAVVVNGQNLAHSREQDWEFWQNLASEKKFGMQLKPVCFRSVLEPQKTLSLDAFTQKPVVAIAGIGNPQRFFQTLQQLGAEVEAHPLKDHQTMRPPLLQSLRSNNEKPLLMTEKDAVKCEGFKNTQAAQWLKNAWYLEIAPEASVELWRKIQGFLQRKT